MRTRLLPFAVLLAVLAPAGDAAAAAWGPPRSLTARGDAFSLSVALGSRHRIGALFVHHYRGESRAELRRGSVRGLGPSLILDRSTHAMDTTALAFDDLKSIAVWRRYVGAGPRGTHRLRASVVDSHGDSLGPYPLSHANESAYDPTFVQGAAGQLLLHWSRRTFSSLAPWEGSPAFGPSTRLPAGAVFDVALALESEGALVAVWPDGGRIMTATRPLGRSFGAPQQISTGGYARDPQLALSTDGHAVAAWLQSTGGANAVMAASRPHGAAFGAPYAIVPADENARAPHMAATTAGEVLVSYVATTSSVAFGRAAGMLRIRRLASDGRPVGSARGLSDADDRVSDSAIAASQTGHALVVWGGRTGSRTAVRSRLLAPGLIRGEIRTLSGSDRVLAGGYVPAVAVRANGEAIVGWLTERFRARYALRGGIG